MTAAKPVYTLGSQENLLAYCHVENKILVGAFLEGETLAVPKAKPDQEGAILTDLHRDGFSIGGHPTANISEAYLREMARQHLGIQDFDVLKKAHSQAVLGLGVQASIMAYSFQGQPLATATNTSQNSGENLDVKYFRAGDQVKVTISSTLEAIVGHADGQTGPGNARFPISSTLVLSGDQFVLESVEFPGKSEYLARGILGNKVAEMAGVIRLYEEHQHKFVGDEAKDTLFSLLADAVLAGSPAPITFDKNSYVLNSTDFPGKLEYLYRGILENKVAEMTETIKVYDAHQSKFTDPAAKDAFFTLLAEAALSGPAMKLDFLKSLDKDGFKDFCDKLASLQMPEEQKAFLINSLVQAIKVQMTDGTSAVYQQFKAEGSTYFSQKLDISGEKIAVSGRFKAGFDTLQAEVARIALSLGREAGASSPVSTGDPSSPIRPDNSRGSMSSLVSATDPAGNLYCNASPLRSLMVASSEAVPVPVSPTM